MKYLAMSWSACGPPRGIGLDASPILSGSSLRDTPPQGSCPRLRLEVAGEVLGEVDVDGPWLGLQQVFCGTPIASTPTGNHEESSRVHEISTNYIDSGESFNHKSTIVDTYFSATIANTLLNDHDPRIIVECEKLSDWPQWKDAIQAELASLNKRKVFTEAIPTPPRVFPVGFKWVFLRKRNENNEVVRYNASCSTRFQRPDIDFNETYSPVMSGITF